MLILCYLSGKLVREFRGTYNSIILDVKFDAARIVRWAICRLDSFL